MEEPRGTAEQSYVYLDGSVQVVRYGQLQGVSGLTSLPSGLSSGLVRKRGFEPLRSCDRQPLKTIRLGQQASDGTAHYLHWAT